MRRIKLKENREVYQLCPEFLMPYMIGKTDEMEKPLYLCQFGVGAYEKSARCELKLKK